MVDGAILFFFYISQLNFLIDYLFQNDIVTAISTTLEAFLYGKNNGGGDD